MNIKRICLICVSICVICVLGCFLSVKSVEAAVPKMLNYQGRLTDESDVLYDGTIVYMKFEIYDDPTAGNELWSSDEDNGGGSETCGVTITPSKGVFNIMIGDTSQSYMADLDQDFTTANYYLQIKAQEGAQCPVAEGNYETLSPRQRVVSSGFSMTSRLLSGDSGEYISSPADDILGFYGLGGTDNTDLYLDLDGTYPTLYSNTDTMVGVDDNFYVSGNVGIGTTGPNEKLEVNGNIRLSPTGDSALYFDAGAEYLFWDDALWPTEANIGDGTGFILSDDVALLGNIIKNVASTDLVIDSHGASSDLIFQTGGSDKVTIASTGNVTLNDSTYGYLTYAAIAQPTGAAGLNYYDSTANMMLYYDGGVSYWRSMQGVSQEIHAPEYPSSVIAADGSNNAGTLITGGELCDADGTNCGSGSTLYTFYRWAGGIGAAIKDYDIYIHLKVPDNFQSWASNAITFYYKTESNVAADNYVNWWIYEDGNAAALMTSADLTSATGGNWYTDSATNTELSALTAGNTYYIQIRLNDNGGVDDYAYAGKIIVYYR